MPGGPFHRHRFQRYGRRSFEGAIGVVHPNAHRTPKATGFRIAFALTGAYIG